jgi:YidC/Oxa1 family membrane protein insertase
LDIGQLLGLLWGTLWHVLLNVLVAINSVVGVPGLSIIIFTLLIRLLTVPLTMKSLRSSRNMQAIQPMVKEIQRQYKDRQKQQEELMKLYQEYGVNPAAGCLPMFVQIPVFFGLYSALQFTLAHGTDVAALREILWNPAWLPHANFSGPFLWVPNLAAADPYHIWPILSGIFQFLQNRMAMPVRNPAQPQDTQQKYMTGMMQFMPLCIVFISWGFPAGTVIYWAFSSIFGAAQQYFITGWGSLPNLPGLGFLPQKPFVPPKAPEKKEGGQVRKKGLMAALLEKANEAQEAQKAAQQTSASTGVVASTDKAKSGATTVRVSGNGKGKTHPVKHGEYTTESAPPRVREGDVAYGFDGQETGPSQLPRKKRAKR